MKDVALIFNIAALVVTLFLAIFATLYLKGKIKTDVPPTKWTLPNTICLWIATVILFLLLFVNT